MKYKFCAAEAECAVIGLVLLKPELIHRCKELKKEDFYAEKNKDIFDNMLDLTRQDKAPDIVNLIDCGLNTIYMSECMNNVSTEEMLPSYIASIKDKAALRALAELQKKMELRLTEENPSASKIISEAHSAMSRIQSGTSLVVPQKELLKQIADNCEQRRKDPNYVDSLGIPTGISKIDESLTYGGIPRGNITTVAAPTSQGKSALVQSIGRHTALNCMKVLHCTLEDSAQAVIRRSISALSKIQNRQLQKEIVGDSEWTDFLSAVNKLYQTNVFFLDSSVSSVDELMAVATSIIQREKIDLVIFDYLQLIPSGQRFNSQQQHTDHTFGAIEQFSKKHKNTATLLVSQMKRHEGKPTIDKLYHSAKLEQGSHTVMMIWNPEVQGWPRAGDFTRKVVDCRMVIVGKQKDGPIGEFVVGWDGNTVRFYSPDSHDAACYWKDLEGAGK